MHSLQNIINLIHPLTSTIKQVTYTTTLLYLTSRRNPLPGLHDRIDQIEVSDRVDQVLLGDNKTVPCHNNYSWMSGPSDNKFTHLSILLYQINR